MNPLILIAGPSASGKTTLALEVARQIGLPCLSLDDYFISKPKLFVETPTGMVRTFERPVLYNGAMLAIKLSNRVSGFVVEGFCLLNYPQILALPAARYYLDVPFSICAKRRAARLPQRPSDESFSIIGEQETAAYVFPQSKLAGVRLLDGLRPIDELAASIVADTLHRAA